MQQTLERRSWLQEARCPGIFAYHIRTIGKGAAWLVLFMLVSSLFNTILPLLVADMTYYAGSGISADVATPMIFLFSAGLVAAGRSTRFVLRFGTSRLSVWLCNVVGLFAATLTVLFGLLLINILVGYLTLWLSQSFPGYSIWTSGGSSYDSAFLAVSLQDALRMIPRQILWVAEYTAIFYLFGCCIRRAKWWTLTVVIGIPAAMMILSVLPVVRQTLNTIAEGQQSVIMLEVMKWMAWFTNAMEFISREWPSIQLGIGVAALPLSYLCMRGTKQP